MMNFHSSSPKTDCRNENSTTKLLENDLFDFHNSIHIPPSNKSQHTCQCMENQGTTMKINVYFIFYGLLLKLT